MRRATTSTPVAVEGTRRIVLRARAHAPSTPSDPERHGPDRLPRALRDRFTIEDERQLGDDGGMYDAYDRSNGRASTLLTCALVDGDWERWERFLRQAQLLRGMQHPGLPVYVEHGECDATAFIVVERVEGRSLAARMLDQERYSSAKLQHIVVRGLDVLEYLHELLPPVFHCDLHPGCIFVSDRGKLTFLGFDRARSHLHPADALDTAPRTGYCRPEQARIEPSRANDLYAFAATVVAIASGRDAAQLPCRGTEIDLDKCMRPSQLREGLALLLGADPAVREGAAARLRASLPRTP